MKTIEKNPYIGPRVFRKDEGDLFFGRDRETADLTGLIISEQLLLFYAQSGAGKSSLLNARIIPELQARGFEVLPVGRVSGDPPYSVQLQNIYLYNLERGLVQQDVNVEAFAALSLTNFLAGLDFDEKGYFFNENPKSAVLYDEDMPRRRLLIIDQFEQFFSTHPEAWAQREDFFRELARAMKDHPGISVVLVMREDYVASLDPYAHILPGGMRVRYYMQRLSREAAIKAVRRPVEAIRPYETGVAEKLVEDLSSIKIQKPDGTQDFEPGQYVEPVQLQVACHSLWQNLPSEGNRITAKDLQEVGDVSQSLGRYYAERVQRVAQEKGVKERLIREWFERELITPGGLRNMVLQEPGKARGGLHDDVIQEFLSDLVRAEKRGGATFYELTHDRLVEPIFADNTQWRSANASPLQRQAALWMDQDRSDNWLLSGQALAELENWAAYNPDELTPDEQAFLEASMKLEAYEQYRNHLNRRQRRILSIVLILQIALSLLLTYIMARGGNPGATTLTLVVAGSLMVGYLLGRYRSR